MRLGLLRYSWIAALAAGWGLTWSTAGWPQDRPHPSGRLALKEALHGPVAETPNRHIEIQVELAWLADPITFPYFLQAKVNSGRLEVEGGVPNQEVRQHTLRLAQLNCSIKVVDAMRENSALAVRPTSLIAPDKLRASAELALRKALPGSHRSLRVECAADGRIVVAGSVGSMEEKHKVSQCLRRQTGCAYVFNMAEVGAATAELTAPPSSRTTAEASTLPPRKGPETAFDILPIQAKEPVRTSAPPPATPSAKKEGPFGGFFSKVFGKSKKTTPPEMTKDPLPPRMPAGMAKDPVKITTAPEPVLPKTGWGPPLPKGSALPKGPELTGGIPDKGSTPQSAPFESSGVMVTAPPAGTVKKGKAPSPTQVKNRLETLFPKARPILVSPQGGNKLKVELTAHNNEDGNNIAGRLLSLPELEAYEVNLIIKIDAPMK